MKKKEDLRVIKTRQSIKNVFFELLEEKPFEKITVSDITGRAMINRATFYLHYKDKFDLMEQIENETLEKFASFISLVTDDTLQKVYKGQQPLPHILPILTYIEENPQFFILIAKNHTSMLFYQKIAQRYYDYFVDILSIKKEGIWSDYFSTAAISMLSSILNKWIERGMQEPKEEMAEWITRLFLNNLRFVSDMALR